MSVLIGTRDGVYRTATVAVEGAEQVLDSGDVPRVRTFPEVGGVHVSDDQGETWTERCDGVHHVHILGADEYVVSCGDGFYRTRDVGQSGTRLDTELDHRYFRETFELDWRLYAAAARSSPGMWSGKGGADAILVESADSGETIETVPYPGGPAEVILTWTAVDGAMLAGTNDGRLISRNEDGTWADVGMIPAGIRSLAIC